MARRASDGVVGRAVDAETVSHLAWLQARPKRPAAEAERVLDAVTAALQKAGASPVTYDGVQRIEAEERARAAEAHIEELKFKSNDEMLALLRR
jgi:hypothetical protein